MKTECERGRRGIISRKRERAKKYETRASMYVCVRVCVRVYLYVYALKLSLNLNLT